MKKSFVIYIATFIIFIIAIIEQVFISNTFNHIINATNNIVKTIEIKNEIPIKEIEDLSEFWQNKEKIICITVNHTNIEIMAEEILNAKMNAKFQKKDEFVVNMNKINRIATGCKERLLFNIQSLF